MKIIRCLPLAGQGVVARYGDLVVVAVDRVADPGPLLRALTGVAAAAGDGRDLVRSVARAALGCAGRPAWACAGVTADGSVTVLLHGRAVATVRVDNGQEATLMTSGSLLPVPWTFTGMTITVGLGTGEQAAPDPQFWLGGGVVHGGGLAVTLSVGAAAPPVIDESILVAPETRPVPGLPFDESSDVPFYDPIAPFTSAPWTDDSQAPPPDRTVNAFPSDPDAGRRHGTEPVLVDGVLCAREHFNDPGARHCRQCGVSLDTLPRNFDRRVRPPLGVLLLDDGTRFTLDQDHVVGREPRLDGDVIAGRARALPISDPDGTVSRLHLKVSLVGWRVEVKDLGSANGSVLHSADGERGLAPLEPAVMEPGARIDIGHRSMRYLPCDGYG